MTIDRRGRPTSARCLDLRATHSRCRVVGQADSANLSPSQTRSVMSRSAESAPSAAACASFSASFCSAASSFSLDPGPGLQRIGQLCPRRLGERLGRVQRLLARGRRRRLRRLDALGQLCQPGDVFDRRSCGSLSIIFSSSDVARDSVLSGMMLFTSAVPGGVSCAGAWAPPVPTSWFVARPNTSSRGGSPAGVGESCQFQNLVRSIFSHELELPSTASPSIPLLGRVSRSVRGTTTSVWPSPPRTVSVRPCCGTGTADRLRLKAPRGSVIVRGRGRPNGTTCSLSP